MERNCAGNEKGRMGVIAPRVQNDLEEKRCRGTGTCPE
jgi:hypothetical protein